MTRAARDWVRAHSPATGTDLLVLKELARWAPTDDGRGVWIANEKLGRELGRSRRTVQRALAALERDDRIRRHRGGRDHCAACATAKRGIVVYDVVIPELQDAPGGPQMSLLTGASTCATDVRHVAHVEEADVRQNDTGTCDTLTHKGSEQEGHQQLENAREGASELVATVDRAEGALSPTRLFVDRYALEAVVKQWHGVRDVDAAVVSVIALVSDPAYTLPKGGAARMLDEQLRRQGEPRGAAVSRFARRPAVEPAAVLEERFAKYDVAAGLA
jgi:hypothetical protein